VNNLDCDFLVFSGHKIFAPTGVGILYVKKDRFEEMKPYQGGGDMIKEVSFEKTTYNTHPHKFEAGTPNIAGVIGLKTALKYVNKIGIDKISEIEDELLHICSQNLFLKLIN
jgi:cysteine desulfurase/selenocysteine lyase